MVELSSDVVSALTLLNSGVVERESFETVLRRCRQVLISPLSTTPEDEQMSTTSEGEEAIIVNTLTFAINSMLLDAAKYNNDSVILIKSLRDAGLDVTTELFKSLIQFIETILPDIRDNLARTRLDGGAVFRSVNWSQKLDVKSSNIDNVRERSFVLDFCHTNASNSQGNFELELTTKELHDLYSTLKECTRSIERVLNKPN